MKRTDAVSDPGASPRRDARRYPRYTLDMRVVVEVFRGPAVQSLWGRCNEIGQDGMSATLTGELQLGEVATLQFTLPRTVAVTKMRALVRHRIGFRHGFEFLALTQAQQKAIQRAVEIAEQQL